MRKLNSSERMKVEESGSRLVGASHRMTTELLRMLCLAIVLACTLSAAQEPPDARTIVVPRDARTIQAAVDEVPDGGTVEVRPGRYEETVWVRRKTVHLVGVDRPMLVGPVPERVTAPERVVGLVNYADGGGGSIRGFHFVGGESAIAGFDRSAPPGALTVRDSHIQKSGRGILWATGPLDAKDVLISGTLWHGISLLQTPTIVLDSITLAHGLGVGIVQVDTGCDCNDQECIVKHTFVNNYLNGGILAIRSGLCVSETTLADNWVFGLQGVGSAIRLKQFAVIGTKARFDGEFGDGVIVRPYALPSTISLSSGYVYGSARAGFANWGSSAKLKNTLLQCNSFDLEGETVPADGFGPGLPPSSLPFSFSNHGGNTCGCPIATGVCVAQSAGLAPPAPIADPVN